MVMQIKVFQAEAAGESTRNCIKMGVLPPPRPPAPTNCPMNVQTIRFGDEGRDATRELVRRLEAALPGLDDPWAGELLRILGALESIDRQYGGQAALPLDEAPGLVAAALTAVAHLENDARRARAGERLAELAELAIGVALWAIRHGVAIDVVEPVANALALRSNIARGKPELSAVFGLMQGVIAHVAPMLAPDLERSNPERPWRILHANLAITAIRTEDPALMAHAFDALDGALPDERAGFYAEALALAMNPRVPEAVRRAVESRHQRWNGGSLS